MAYDTYDGLKETIAEWLHRTNLTERIPDFIRLAEQTINRRLTIFPKEVDAALVTVAGSRFIPLPDDFGSPISMQSAAGMPIPLVDATVLRVNAGFSGEPCEWAIDGTNIAFGTKTDKQYPVVLRYVRTLYLSDTAQTNPLLDRAGDLYLYGALASSAQYTWNDARLPIWEQKFNALLTQVAAEASRSKGMAPLQTEIAGVLNSGASGRDWRN